MTAASRTVNRDLLDHNTRWRFDELTERARSGNLRVKHDLERLTARLLAQQELTVEEAAEAIRKAREGVSVGPGGNIPLPALLGLTGEADAISTRTLQRFDVDGLKRDISPAQVLESRGIQVRGGKCACPVHGSRGDGVMAVYADHVHCHSCGFHGDVIALIMTLENCDFRTACEILGGRREPSRVIAAPTRTAAVKPVAPVAPQRDLRPLAEKAQQALWDGVGASDPQCIAALEYLTVERGFTVDQVEQWGLGLITPAVPSALLPLIRDHDRPDERWRGRITIPCKNADGSVYTVKARSVGTPPAHQDKYFNPARVSVRPFLWGQLQSETDVLIVEGELDALSALAAGIDDVIAVPGVGALSEAHALQLAARQRPVYLLLDPDTLLERTILGDLKDVPDAELPTGPARPARNLARRLLAAGVDLRLVSALPGGSDLNNILSSHGPDVLLEQIVLGLQTAVSLKPQPKRRKIIN